MERRPSAPRIDQGQCQGFGGSGARPHAGSLRLSLHVCCTGTEVSPVPQDRREDEGGASPCHVSTERGPRAGPLHGQRHPLPLSRRKDKREDGREEAEGPEPWANALDRGRHSRLPTASARHTPRTPTRVPGPGSGQRRPGVGQRPVSRRLPQGMPSAARRRPASEGPNKTGGCGRCCGDPTTARPGSAASSHD